jgi:S1-C subfamily serine protease
MMETRAILHRVSYEHTIMIGTDPKSDVALIKAKGADNLPVMPLANSEDLEIGEWVLAIGNPFGLSHTLTVGLAILVLVFRSSLKNL